MVAQPIALHAQNVVAELKSAGVTHVVWLPDSESNFMYEAMQEEPALNLVPVCREGEAMAVAAGLIMGGKKPVVLIQNTGFLESGDSIRGICIDLKMPLVLMIGYRGFEREKPMTDTAGIFLEPALNMYGIPYTVVEEDEHLSVISKAVQEAQDPPHTVAVLIAVEYDTP